MLRLWWGILACCLLTLPTLAQVTLQRAPRYVLHMDISPDNQWLVVSHWYGATALYSLPDRRLVRGLSGSDPVFAGNRLLALDTADGVILRDLPSLRPVKRLPTSGKLEASRDGHWLLVYRSDAGFVAELWQLIPAQRRLSLALPSDSAVALSADGRFLFQVTPAGADSSEVIVRATSDGRVVRRFVVDTSGKFAVSPSGDRVAFARPTQVRVYRVADAQLLYNFTDVGSFGFTTLRFSPDGNYLAGGYGALYENGAWRLWRLTDGALIAGETYSYSIEQEVWSLGFSGDSTALYVAFPHRILLIDTRSGVTLDEWRASRWERALGFLSSEEEYAIADEQGIRFYASANGSLTRQVDLPAPAANAFAATISGNGSTYAVYPYQNGIGVFRLPQSGFAIPLLTVPLFPNTSLDEPMLLRLTEDGSSLFVRDASDRVHRIQVADGSITPLADGVISFDITPDGSLLVTAEEEVKVWRVSDGALLYTLPPMLWFGVAQEGQQLATVWGDEESDTYLVSLYHLPTGTLLRYANLFLPRDPRDPQGASVRVSPDAKVIVATRGSSLTRRETALYRWDNSYPRLITLWRGGAAPSELTFSRNGRYVAIGSVIQRGFSDKVGVWGTVILNGWCGVFPEHLRYTLRDTQRGELLDEGALHIVETLDNMVARFILPVPADRSPESLRLTVEGRPFLKRTMLVSEISMGWPPKPVYLLLGDIDGDNEVTLFDFGRLVTAFGSFAGEERYDIDADLDGDGEISLWDFAWLVTHFGLAGDD